MSTQFDQIFEGLSKNSMTLEDACRVLYSESQASPESMRVCCERIESELSQGRITSDAAQLLLDALGERSKEDQDAGAGEEMWVDVPLEPLQADAPRTGAAAVVRVGGDTITEVDLTMDDLLAALDRRGTPAVKAPAAEVANVLAEPLEWMEWEPEQESPPEPSGSSVAIPLADVEVMLGAELNLAVAPSPMPVSDPGAEVVTFPEPSEPAFEPAAAVPMAITIEAVAVQGDEAVLHPVDIDVPPAIQIEAAPAERVDLVFSATQTETETTPLEQVDDLIPVPIAAQEAAAGPEIASEAPALLAAIELEAVPVPTAEAPVPDETLETVPPADAAHLPSERPSDPAIDEVFAPRVEHVLRESSPMAAGARLKDRYRIVGPLASGGLGQLFEAVDMQVAGAPRVALKLIDVDWQEEPRAFETLQAIVRHVRRLRHPNILAILDIDRDDKHAIIAMEPLRGCWLSSLVREVRGRGVGYAVAWNIISGIANGLAYAHHHGAVHSELNPHMVFLTDTGQVKIVGFGLAHAMPMSTEPLAELDGQTLRGYADAYCATHWIMGSIPQGVDDLYPLGVIAYELLTGAHPFNRASPAAAASQQLQLLPIPGLDRRIRRVIERCLSFERKARPASGASFLAHIEPSEKLLDLVRDRFT